MKIELVPIEIRRLVPKKWLLNLMESYQTFQMQCYRISAASSIGGGGQAPITFFLQGT